MQPPRPNVVMILLDDLGFAELGCYGSKIATPHIDRLAASGLRYNNFHVTPLRSPTRACLMTGRNHHAVGMGFLTDLPMDHPAYTACIPRSAGTLPRLLRDTGYNTFAVGKWHLAPLGEKSAAGPFDRWPLGMGFERYYGFLGGYTDQWTPRLVTDNALIESPRAPREGYHLTEDLTDQAIQMVQDQQQAAPGKPFFLYFATGAMHSPHQAPREWIERYSGQFDDGWDAARAYAHTRQLKEGLVPAGTALTERPPWVATWDDLSDAERQVFARQMETYAEFLSHTDAQIGRLVGSLDELGALENTIIMVLSDNGAAGDSPQGWLSTDATDVPSMLRRIDDFGGPNTEVNTYASGWAWAGNTPFKLWKSYTWLGGVRVPLIVNWPMGINPHGDTGEVRPQFSHAIDLMPTILEVAGIEAPGVLDGVSQLPLDGASLSSTFTSPEAPAPRDTQYFEMIGSRAIYHDGWKSTTDHVKDLDRQVVQGSHDFEEDRWSLYNLRDDFSEAHDRADTEPDRLRRMIELWWHEAGRNQVLPLTDQFYRTPESVRSALAND